MNSFVVVGTVLWAVLLVMTLLMPSTVKVNGIAVRNPVWRIIIISLAILIVSSTFGIIGFTMISPILRLLGLF